MYHRSRARIYIIIILLLVFVPIYYWQQIDSLVSGSPYWSQSPAKAKEVGSFVSPIAATKGLPIAGSDDTSPEIWLERSHSYVRSGPFSAKAVLNQEFALHVLFHNHEILKIHMTEGLRISLDGTLYDPVLTADGGLIGPHLDCHIGVHRLSLVVGDKTISECEFVFPRPSSALSE